MRHIPRRVTQLIGILMLAGAVVIGFQNCGTYEPLDNPLYSNSSSSTCIGFGCTMDPESIEIVAGNGNVIGVPKPASAPTNCDDNASMCFDVAGFCEDGAYPNNQIFLALDGPTPVAEYPTSSKCDDMGRFSVRVQLPANYDYNQTYQLRVTLRGIQSDGKMIDNPKTSNIQPITLVPAL